MKKPIYIDKRCLKYVNLTTHALSNKSCHLTRMTATTEGLLPDHRSSRFVVDVKIAGCLFQLLESVLKEFPENGYKNTNIDEQSVSIYMVIASCMTYWS